MDPPSVVSHRFAGNSYAQFSEVTVDNKKNLRRLEEQLQGLDDEISRLRNRLCSLSRQEKLLSGKAGFQSPVYSLIPEILQEIFQCCLPAARYPVMSNREAPILLGQVCGWWREIAHTTPGLWAAIHVSIPEFYYSRPYSGRKVEALRLEGINLWLSRSGALPLSISLSQPYPPISFSTRKFDGVTPYLDVLSPFSARWRTINFHGYDFDWIKAFFSRYQISDLPLLEALNISGSRYINCVTMHRNVLFSPTGILRSPKLRRVSLPLFEELIFDLPLPWSQLTALDLSHLPATPLFQIMKALSLCINLTALSIYFDPASSDLPNLPLEQNLTFPSLRVLCITDSFQDPDASRFLDHVRAPVIRQIVYDRVIHPLAQGLGTPDEQSRGLVGSLALFAGRAINPIEEFSLCYDWMTEGELIKLLSLFPDLKRLSLRGFGRSACDDWAEWDLRRTRLGLDDELFHRVFTIPRKRYIIGGIMRDGSDILSDDADTNGTSTFGNDITVQGGEVLSETHDLLLCPKLEVFHCTGAMFSGECLLEFLHCRSVPCSELGVERIRNVDVTFLPGLVEMFVDDVIDGIKLIQEDTGVSVSIHSGSVPEVPAPPSPVRYSPHEGLPLDTFSFNVAF